MKFLGMGIPELIILALVIAAVVYLIKHYKDKKDDE